MEDVTERKISQFREGSLGRLSSQETGIPVYFRAVRNPEGLGDFTGSDGGVAAF